MAQYLRFLFISLLISGSFSVVSCKSKSRVVTTKKHQKRPVYRTKKPIVTINPKPSSPNKPIASSNQADAVVSKALSYKGTRYKLGGTSKSGMDCSGLMFTSFKAVNINLPRTSLSQSSVGKTISTSKIQKGDLLFFKTSNKNRINHVGLVVSRKGNDIKFIHSSTSRGVMISSLREGYWSQAYTKANRVFTYHTPNPNSEPISNNKNTHTVAKGDTLYSISRKYNTSVNSIMKLNRLTNTQLRIGLVLKIPRN